MTRAAAGGRAVRLGLVAVWQALLLSAICAAEPPDGDLRDGGSVSRIVEEALERGDRVILKRVEYRGDGTGAAAGPAGGSDAPVHSKTYIEIDSRTPSPPAAEMIESQRRVERNQREMQKAVRAIGIGQENIREGMAGVESSGQDLSVGMKSSRVERTAVRGDAARTGAEVSDVNRTVQDSERLLRSIDAQTKALSSAVGDLASRVEGLGENIKDTRGERGERGEKGDRGEKGESGEKGEDGSSGEGSE